MHEALPKQSVTFLEGSIFGKSVLDDFIWTWI